MRARQPDGLSRRHLMQALIGTAIASCVPGRRFTWADDETFQFATVSQLARALSRRPFKEQGPLPDTLQRLSYDQYRLIAFRHERALWGDTPSPFWVEFHHRGFVARDIVDVSLIEGKRERPFPFDPELFQYRGELASMKPSADWGLSGYRLLCRLPRRKNFQEFCSFQGASYFRAICTDQVYGASARGLAVDMGLSRPEEFPSFRRFWIERPTDDSPSIRVWALLDGPSVSGAYEFRITPGLERTTLDIDCELFFRRPVEKLGLAPMSSMWAWGRGGKPTSDPRPEVHDSDGLLIFADNGEWLWRPLARRDKPSVSRFGFDSLHGFGLMQRERDPGSYRDKEALYHLRPSVWITPRKPWGAGSVELLELPTDRETDDNIAACWVPKQPVRAGDTLSLAYQVAFAATDPPEHTGGRFVRTEVESLAGRDTAFHLVVDSAVLRGLAADAKLQPVVTATRGRVADADCSKLPTGAWRLRFRRVRDGDGPSELRAFVRQGETVLSETWSYLCT